MNDVERYVAWLLAHVGGRYYNSGPGRCTGDPGYDCSGFAGAGLVALGAQQPGYCIDTKIAAQQLRAGGLLVSREYARTHAGCWAIRTGPDKPLSKEHIVVTLGVVNGVARTVEAASHALGIIIGYFDGREWEVFGKPPGLTGFDQASSPVLTPGVNVGWKIVHHPKSTDAKPGYWCVDDAGKVYAYGLADYHGGEGFTLPNGKKVHLNGKCDGFGPTPTGDGYSMITSVGSVYAFGDAHNLGDPHGDPAT